MNFISKPTHIGVVAGWGNYPLELARQLKKRGCEISVAAIRNHASGDLEAYADHIRWFGVAKLGHYQRWFQRRGVSYVVLAGKIFKEKLLFHGLGWIHLIPDVECVRTMFPHFILRSRTTSDDDLLSSVVASFERRGLTIVPGTDLAPNLLAQEGCLTKRKPTSRELVDMQFGWRIAKSMGALDIGQTVTVRDQTVLCVEAVEGTDACIARTSVVCPRGGFVVAKVAKPNQNQRFDLPTIGMNTVRQIHRAGGKCLLIEALQTIVVERDQVLQFMNKHGMTLVAWSQSSVASPQESTTGPKMVAA